MRTTSPKRISFPKKGDRADPRAAPRGQGDGPGVLGLTVGGVCETPSVRFLNLGQQLALSLRLWRLRYHRQAGKPCAEAANRRTLAHPAPRRQPASCNALPSARSGFEFRLRNQLPQGRDIPPPVRGNVLLDSTYPTWCTSSAKRPSGA